MKTKIPEAAIRAGVEALNRASHKIERHIGDDDVRLVQSVLAAAAPHMHEWQPIETAPESGAFLVLLEKPMLGSHIHSAKWHPSVKTISGVYSFDAPKATHWMEYPAIPGQEASNENH